MGFFFSVVLLVLKRFSLIYPVIRESVTFFSKKHWIFSNTCTRKFSATIKVTLNDQYSYLCHFFVVELSMMIIIILKKESQF